MRLVWRRLLVRWLPLTMVTTAVTTGLLGVTPHSDAVVADHVTRVPSAAGLREIRVDQPIDLVGFAWNGSSPGTIQLRAWAKRGRWRGWTTVASDVSEGPDAHSSERRGRTTAGPFWVGRGVTRVQFRVVRGLLIHLQVHAIRSENAGTSGTLVSADAAVREPWFITRAKWGADESWRTLAPGCPSTPRYADTVRHIVVHDTATANNYGPADSAAIVRAIYFFHTHVVQWCDVGYNFLVDKFGQIFEGRFGGIRRPVIGAHAGGFNTGSSGVALIGTYDKAGPPRAMYSGLRVLASWLSSTYRIRPKGTVTVTTGDFPDANWPPGTVVTVPTINGHRDLDKTDCPGDAAYGLLPRLRNDVAIATHLR
ncbi:MAG TPA: N-acetylmuramoyl-L-alanine amidase [Acidimicrobiales bacterium]